MPQPTWVSETQPETGSSPTGCIGAARRWSVRPRAWSSAFGGPVVVAERGDADRADGDRRGRGDQAAGDPGAAALGPARAAYQRGQQGVRHRLAAAASGSTISTGTRASRPGSPASSRTERGSSRAAGQVPLEGDPLLGGERAEDVGAVLVLVLAVGHAPTPISSRASRRARRA